MGHSLKHHGRAPQRLALSNTVAALLAACLLAGTGHAQTASPAAPAKRPATVKPNASTDGYVVEATPGWEIADPKNHTNEGPHVFERGGDYYLLYSANHFLDPHYATGYARSKNPLGPFTKAPNNPVLKARAELGVAGTGHVSVALSPDGAERFLVYHAHDPKARNVRPLRRA